MQADATTNWVYFPIPTGTVAITRQAMSELCRAYEQRMAGLNVTTNLWEPYTRQVLATNVSGGVTNYYLTNTVVFTSNNWNSARFTGAAVRKMVTSLLKGASSQDSEYPWWNFVQSHTNLTRFTKADIAGFASGYLETNYFVNNDLQQYQRTASNLAVIVWAHTNANSCRIASYGDMNYSRYIPYSTSDGLDVHGQRALTNLSQRIVYRPASLAATNVTVTIEGWTPTDLLNPDITAAITNEQVVLTPNGTSALSHVYFTSALGLEFTAVDEVPEPTITVNAGSFSTGDQVVVYLNHLDVYISPENPVFWDTRTILNAIYEVLDEMRTLIFPVHVRFLDGWYGQGADYAAASNAWAQLPGTYEFSDKPPSYFGFVWSGNYTDGPYSNTQIYSTKWAVTNAARTAWNGHNWQAQYLFKPVPPLFNPFNDNGLGYTNNVQWYSAWNTMTNSVIQFSQTIGTTNMAVGPGLGGVNWGASPTPLTGVLRLDTDDAFICTPR